MSCGESQGEDKSVKSCDFRLTERNCLRYSSGWIRSDDVTTHDNFFIMCSLTYRNNGEDCFGAIFLEPKTSKNYHLPHLLSFKRLYAPVN